MFDLDSFYREAFSDLAWLFDDEGPEESTGGSGGGSGRKLSWGDMPVDYSFHTMPRHQTADVAILAAASGLI